MQLLSKGHDDLKKKIKFDPPRYIDDVEGSSSSIDAKCDGKSDENCDKGWGKDDRCDEDVFFVIVMTRLIKVRYTTL